MSKIILLLSTVVFLGFSSMAAECQVNGIDVLNDPAAFTAAIETSATCWEATQLATACAWGSSLDVHTTGAAYQICQTELDSYNPDKSTTDLLESMKDKCEVRWANEEGTLGMSIMSFCHLSAIEWITTIASPFGS